ncbi:hypothetical protein ABFA07_022612 [Porites harrisoni]
MRRKALGQSGVRVLRLAAAEDKADSETVPSLKENGTTAPITKYSNPDFARIGRVQILLLNVTSVMGQRSIVITAYYNETKPETLVTEITIDAF